MTLNKKFSCTQVILIREGLLRQNPKRGNIITEPQKGEYQLHIYSSIAKGMYRVVEPILQMLIIIRKVIYLLITSLEDEVS